MSPKDLCCHLESKKFLFGTGSPFLFTSKLRLSVFKFKHFRLGYESLDFELDYIYGSKNAHFEELLDVVLLVGFSVYEKVIAQRG